MLLNRMSLPMVTCPLCCRPGFTSSDSLCSALVDVTTRQLSCPICNFTAIGLDKFTIHLFSHIITRKGQLEPSKDHLPICNSNNAYYSTPEECNKTDNNGSIFCFKSDNGQVLAISPENITSSFKSVTINTQNFITNTNITSNVENPVEKVQKRKYSEVFEQELNLKNDNENYSVNSWPSSSSVSSENEKTCGTPENEFESCKDLLTKGDFTTLNDENEDFRRNIRDSEQHYSRKDGFSCDSCPVVLPNKTILAMHKQLIHKRASTDDESKRKLLDCGMCSRTFTLRSSLIIHQKVAHAGGFGVHEVDNCSKETRNMYSCITCGKSFKKEIHLNQHMKSHDEKHWQCNVCFKTFTTKYFLKKHRRLHTGETPYKCSKCEKAFTFQQSYHKHLLYHNDEKPYSCTQCGRAFKELSTLHNHERIHSGEKPFTCESCGKSFRQRVSYLVHRRIHTGAMPYKCTACNKSFRYKISQRTHKCSAQPPGVVVRTSGSLVERLQAAMSKSPEKEEEENANPEITSIPSVPGPSNENVNISSPQSTTEISTVASTPLPMTQEITTVPESSNPPSVEPLKIQLDRPQLYILFKGDNNKTYYQPLIITQTLEISPNVSGQSNMISLTENNPLADSNVKIGNTKEQPSIEALSSGENNVFNPEKSIESEKHNSNNEDIVNESHNYERISSNSIKIVSFDASRSSSEPCAMEEILNELNCNEYELNANNNDYSENSTSKVDCGAGEMDSGDMFSFMLNPDVSSPSDRLGKLTLSPEGCKKNGNSHDEFNSPVCANNVSESQNDILDKMSDDALKELLFGKY